MTPNPLISSIPQLVLPNIGICLTDVENKISRDPGIDIPLQDHDLPEDLEENLTMK